MEAPQEHTYDLLKDRAKFPLSMRHLPETYEVGGVAERVKPLPQRLFVKGELLSQDVNPVAIIGTRDNLTAAGADFAGSIAMELAKRGITIISGLALGTDGLAHTFAMAPDNGRTIAVLPSSFDDIKPKTHQRLADKVAQRGALITEYSSPTQFNKGNYLRRNHLIVSMSRLVIAIEGLPMHGTHKTTKLAYEAGVPVAVFYSADNKTETAYLQNATSRLKSDNLRHVSGVHEVLEWLGVS